ncbi:hypothetical protein BDZ88DRAFT_415862 [Geranomyces variabilis]|nr:hypothetical protein BDZ88DRAFT_415862 [Geranomyces variabilis]KAJ3141336.1 Tetratricopeptide repeat protein 21B [Geranomyces variabilis]
MSAQEDLATVSYYCRRGLYRHVYDFCDLRLKRRVGDPALLFWKATTLTLDGRPGEALRALEPLQEKRDLTLAAIAAMIYAHQQSRHVDAEAVQELEAKLAIANESSGLSAQSLILAGMFHHFLGSAEDARACVKKALEAQPESNEALALMGWIDLASPKDAISSKASVWFDRALEHAPKDTDATMGRLQCLRKNRRQLTAALDLTSQMIAHHASFAPAYIERMYVLLELSAWDQAVEAANRLIGMVPESIDASIMLVIHQLAREGDSEQATTYLATLIQRLERLEPRNANFLYCVARSFIRLSGKNAKVLNECAKLLERAVSIEPNASRFKNEMGYLHLLLDNLPRAKEYYQEAATLDSQNVDALQGLIRCQLCASQFEAAEEQIELFNEFQMGVGTSADIQYLASIVAWYKHGDATARIKLLSDAAQAQVALLQTRTISLDYFAQVNPVFLMEIVKDISEHCPAEPKRDGEDVHELVKVMLNILEPTCKVISGSTDALYYLAKAKFLAGDKVVAQTVVKNCLRLDNTYAKGYLLLCQIYISNGQEQQAGQFLETGLSYNFEVRNIPLYLLLKSRIAKAQGQLNEALDALRSAMQLPGMKETLNELKRAPKITRTDFMPTVLERMSIYLETVDAHAKLKNLKEAERVMKEANKIFAGTPEEDRLVLANAEFAIERGDVDTALNLLATVGADQPHYVDAKKRMAEVYLKHKNDKKAYARCYSELVERNPTVESCLLLGDAYMNLQEPEKAIAIYESAMDSSAEAGVLASKIGKALVRTHHYARAISYYESALSSNGDSLTIGATLRYDLAELYYKLGRHDDAESLLMETIDHQDTDDIGELQMDVKCHTLLAKSYKSRNKSAEAKAALLKARDLQQHLLSKESVASDNRDVRIQLSKINHALGELLSSDLKDPDGAVMHYGEAVEQDPDDVKSTLALCGIYMQQNDLTSAQQQCASMLRADPENEGALMLMADIMALKNSYTEAVEFFRQMLDKCPTHYVALSRLIETMRRSGGLENVPRYLTAAENSSFKVHLHPGFHFCKGLYFRYTNSPNEALKEFNFCRKDNEWGERALNHMIEIFLNPDNETLGGEALENATDESSAAGARKGESELLAVLTADKLLKELPQSPKSLQTQVLECNALLATKQKTEIERALNRFMEMLNVERDHVPALLGMAICHMLLKQPPRARNQLKRIAKMEWNSALADEFERSWILLADLYIQGGKFDLATELLKMCLARNQSCAKASEYLGFIMEKEGSYADAATHYEKAWRLDREANPVMGYKLAFNYLKAKKYVEAIDISHKVLQMYPEYPKIRAEILIKARTNLRCP